MSELKAVTWTITNAVILAGKGEKAVKDQAIFSIKGTIHRSDSKSGDALKGNVLDWTPDDKANGFTLDLSKFDRAKGTGTIKVNGFIGKGGRKEKAPVTGETLNSLLDLA
jgi:hypothetical protein